MFIKQSALLLLMLSCVSARNIEEVDLKIDDNIIDDQDATNVLDFSNMNITSLNKYSVSSLLKTFIDLSYNNIASVDSSVFIGVPNLVHLNLTGNWISRRLLDLKLPNLETLVLDKALRMTGDGFIGEYRLTVGDNSDESDVISVLRLPNLKKLYLRKNNIKYIHGLTEKRLPNLTHLYLSENDIKYLDFVEELPTSLTHLYLDNNHILKLMNTEYRSEHSGWCTVLNPVSVPYKFGHLKNLVHLDLSHNEISYVIDNSFQNLTNLKVLLLDHNNLSSIPDFHGLLKMRRLDLRYNNITHIDREAFRYLPSLKELQISKNPLGAFEFLIERLNLEYMFLQGNSFKNVRPIVFAEMD